ncbi:hypothetical protein [Saccharothrix obliqua]|uniref:hypothetical protein n=1 Tax=Saccharothrix obliqua TaxID=2861747 RepID=UPI001C5FD4FA|nr:hypothetical protein [Saccharothrix obliqua]MBW4717165.1 hypothetical protein [Saccharothrix obliqua]
MIRHRLLAAAVLSVAIAGVVVVAPAQAVPVRGHTGWSVLLCKFADRAAEPRAPQFFREFLTRDGTGLGGLADYFTDQSGGRITLSGSVVRGWYTMPYTLAQEQAKDRWTKIQDCVGTAAANGYQVPAGHRIIAILNDFADSGAAGDRVVLDPGAWNVGFAAHEMLHGYGLGHSFSDDPTYRNVDWAQIGEYDDPWDEMSAMNIHAFGTARFGTSAVGLNGYFRDKLGWLPRSRVRTLGSDGIGTRTVTLAPLELPGNAGPQLLRIPFDPADPFRYYTVEYRAKTGWSAGIPANTVLIHEVRNGTPYLLRTRGGTRNPVQSLYANGVSVQINWQDANNASVSVSSEITERCLQGYVWREARPSDRVCVVPAVRQQAWADNAVAASRWVNGPYGPHTCVSGYVWREAFPGDDVCVLPANRSQAWADNAAAADRVNPARFVYGPNTCKAGYVWREADDADYTCVVPAVRQQAWADNAVAASRWVNGPYGPHTCVSGYVWREAFPGDDVCVLPANRSQAWADNAAAAGRVERP